MRCSVTRDEEVLQGSAAVSHNDEEMSCVESDRSSLGPVLCPLQLFLIVSYDEHEMPLLVVQHAALSSSSS